ncbi:MAG: hypothetical protein ACRDCE_18950 [Cetobacterium sp.]|uniref:hypothetical protein n=1 Tax=Cetobacterium sp. TaxID=2071632 RepID=UPI003EE7B0AA
MKGYSPKELRKKLIEDYGLNYRPSFINKALCQLGLQRQIKKATGGYRYTIDKPTKHGQMVYETDFSAARWNDSILPILADHMPNMKDDRV